MSLLLALITLLTVACARPEESEPKYLPLSFAGSVGTQFSDTGRLELGGFRVVDSSSLLVNGEIKTFFDWEGGGAFASDVGGSVTSLAGGENFTYVFAHGGLLYKFGFVLGDIYMSRSSDGGLTFVRMNGGLPVVRHSTDPASDFNQIWNPGVDVDDQGVWHMLLECSDQTPGQRAVGLCYLTGTLSGDSLVLTPVSPSQVIRNAGNPYVKYLPGRGLLVVHGSINGPDVAPFSSPFWYVTASTLVGGVFSEHTDRFAIGTPGVHDCDPHLVERPGGGLILTLSVNQSHIQTAETDLSFEGLFDALRGI